MLHLVLQPAHLPALQVKLVRLHRAERKAALEVSEVLVDDEARKVELVVRRLLVVERQAGGEPARATLGAPTASSEQTPASESAPAAGEGTPQRTGGNEGRSGSEGRGGGGGRVRSAPSGSYRVVLVVDGKEFSQELRLITDPNLPALNDLLSAEEEYELWQGDDEPFDRDLKERHQTNASMGSNV